MTVFESGEVLRVLLADDDLDDCEMFAEAVAEISARVSFSCVNDGEHLIRQIILEKKLPDILFLDLNMPRKSGFNCLVELKSNPITRNLPIIIFSTSASRDVMKVLLEYGAHRFISKPTGLGKFKTAIQMGLQSASLPEALTLSEFVIQP